jgi:hypothetical protein
MNDAETIAKLAVDNSIVPFSIVEMADGRSLAITRDNDGTVEFEDITLPGARNVGIEAFLRRRIDGDGVLTLGYKLSRAENIRQAMFHEIVGNIATEVNLMCLYGSYA